jgi:hypothetical protein
MAKSGRMNEGVRSQKSGVRRRNSGLIKGLLLLIMVFCGITGQAANVISVRVETLEKAKKLVVPIPPLASITGRDDDGATWQQTGTMAGALDRVRGDFRQSMRAGGWVLDKTIAMGRAANRSELAIWTIRGHRILLMIWEKEAGLCGFSWGEETGGG